MITTTTIKNAARAIEHDLWTDPSGANYLVKDGAILRRWEPEHDNGDSFRLMAALGMDVCSAEGGQFVEASFYRRLKGFRGCCNHTDDRAQDCRTAILLCAAKIGAAL